MPVVSRLAFPNSYYAPAQSAELPDGGGVTQFVPGKLVDPIFDVSTWHATSPLAFVTMPKTAVNKNYRLDARQHKIRSSRQAGMVKARFITRTSKPLLNRQFGLGAFRTDGAHDARTKLSRLCRLRFLLARLQLHSRLP